MNIQKLYPAYKDYIWGGNKLKEHYSKHTDLTPCAESWELSFHKDGMTRLADGRTLAESVNENDLGANAKAFDTFPMLVKFIDARQNLSVQVHPEDAYALANEASLGKTEMWYIVQADPGAGIYLGFSKDVTKEEYKQAITEHRLTDLLNFYPVSAGECYFIPAGTIHAIGGGCLICEIQQNSNLTYRVYDYGRKDANGNERELHIEKALRVTNLSKYERIPSVGTLLGASKYFCGRAMHVEHTTLTATDKTFQCLTCVKGSGEIEGQVMKTGDSFFVPAGYGAYTLHGDMELILTELRKYYIGIDLGGTFIKGGIIDDTGEILVSGKAPTQSEKGAQAILNNISALCHSMLKQVNLTLSDITGVGMGVPGMIDSKKGEVIYSNNLGWEHFSISHELESQLGVPVRIANDANVAALGETRFGCGKDYQNTVMLTLGTGVGGGIVIDGALFEGNSSAGAELGHAVIVAGGEPCTCGRRGCLEAYASATALIRDTRRAMLENPNSRMWKIGSIDNVTGKTAFDFQSEDESAKQVVNRYIQMLGAGITNLANEFRPEAVILGGGVCNQGEELIRPLQEILDTEIFAGSKGPQVQIVVASRGNDAGMLGAAALWMI